MILADKRIKEEIANGNIIISPFDQKYLNPNSVDLTLNPTFKIYTENVLDVKKENQSIALEMAEEGFVLQPGCVYLYACNEKIGVKGNLCAKVEGKSSLGRLGLFVHVTAGWIDANFEGSLVLELVATQPIKIYPNMKICQIAFYETTEVEIGYDKIKGSKYMNQEGVVASKMHKNF
jgi:dCTP deaminase